MTIFSRFRDIVSANINSMLEKAEDPEKLIKLMIQEMEDTLVEIKASCAGTMANRTRVNRRLEETKAAADRWSSKAELALSKGREDLAREALVEKRNYAAEAEKLERESAQFDSLVDQYQHEIVQLEEKLQSAREKHRVLVERATQAEKRKKVQETIRRVDTNDAFVRFQKIENRIERMEADADMVNYGHKPTLDEEFARLESDSEIEDELAALKKKVSEKSGGAEA